MVLCDRALAVPRDIHRTLLVDIGEIRRNAKGVEDGGMQVFDRHRVLDRRARALIGSLAVEEAAFRSAAKH